jgi:hypothetical protein
MMHPESLRAEKKFNPIRESNAIHGPFKEQGFPRGCFFGLLLSLVPWGVVGWIVWMAVR